MELVASPDIAVAGVPETRPRARRLPALTSLLFVAAAMIMAHGQLIWQSVGVQQLVYTVVIQPLDTKGNALAVYSQPQDQLERTAASS